MTIAGNATKSLFAFKTTADISGGQIVMSSLANTSGKSEVGGVLINGTGVTISSNLYFDSSPSGVTATSANAAASGEALFYVAPGKDGTLTGNVFARGLTKFGEGTLVLSGTNQILGNLTVQGGTLQLGAAGSDANRVALATPQTFATPLAVNSGGTLDLNGVSYTFDSLGTTGGAAGGIITNSSVNSNELGRLIINGFGNPTINILRTGTTNSTATVSGLNTADLFVGQSVAGTGIAAGTFITGITSVVSGSSVINAITLSAAATASGTPTLTFGSIYEGRITGNVRLVKAGLGTLTLGSYNTINPDAGNNSYTGGTELQSGVLTILNPLNLGGAATPAGAPTIPGKLELLGGSLRVRINGGNNNGSIIIGNQDTAGINVDLNASSTIDIGNAGANTGNAIQIGDLRLAGATLSITAANNYYLKVAGTTTIGDKSADAWTDLVFNTNGPGGALEIAGRLVGDGLIYKRDNGTGVLRTLVISGTNNGPTAPGPNADDGFRGNILIAGGAVQITGNSGAPIGTGTVTVLPGGQLRIAGNNSLGTGTMRIGSQVNSWAGVGLDGGFNPTFLTNNGAFSSKYGALLQITTPFYNQVLDMSTIGNGRAFLVAGLNFEAGLNPTPLAEGDPALLPGAADDFVANQRVYRLSGGTNGNLALVGVDNTLQDVSGSTFLQIGPIANNFGSVVQGTGNSVIFRQANNFTGGTQIVRGLNVTLDTGANSTVGFSGSPLGTGAVEIYGALTLGFGGGTGYGGVASLVNSVTGTNYNSVVLRPGGQLIINDVAGEVPGGQGRWADAAPLNLNGGTLVFQQVAAAAVTNGSQSVVSYEKIGTVTAGKGGALRVVRTAGAGQAVLELAGLSRGTANDRGTLLITNSTAVTGAGAAATSALGVISTASTLSPTNYERLLVTGGIGTLHGNTTIGGQVLGAIATAGIAPVWMVDATSNTYLTYSPMAVGFDGNTGFQSMISAPGTVNGPSGSLGLGQVGYNRVFFQSGGAISGTAAGDVVDIQQNAQSLTGTANLYAMRLSQNIAVSSGATIAFAGGNSAFGGLLFNGNATISLAQTNAPNLQSTLSFGTREAVIYTASGVTGTINSQITQTSGAGGLTKFGAGALVLAGSNTIIGNVVVNGGTLQLNNPYSGNGGAAVRDAVNGQTIVLNGNGAGTGTGQAGTTTLIVDSLLANNQADRDSVFGASVLRVSRTMNSAVIVQGDAAMTNANQAVMQRIDSLAFADLGARSPVFLNFSQAGIGVRNTTTLGANSNAVNVSFGNFLGMVMFDGKVTGGADGRLIKTGNGMLFLNGTNSDFGTAGKVGLEVWGSVQNTATSIVGTTARSGTPFGAGDVNLLPGAMLRLADSSNISAQRVFANSDILGLAGISFGYHNYDGGNHYGLRQSDILAVLTTGAAQNGKVQFTSTGNYLGVIALDNGWQYGALDLHQMETSLGGKIWLGASTGPGSTLGGQIYFAPTLAPAWINNSNQSAGAIYRLGGGGNQGTLNLGFNAFENVLKDYNGAKSHVSVGANDFGFNAVSYVNGNFSLTLRTRNNFTGDITAQRDSTLNIENSFALGTGKLIVNQVSDVTNPSNPGGLLQTSGGVNIAINNDVEVLGDLRYNGGNDFVIRGNVNLTPAGDGGTRVLQVGTGGAGIMSILGVVSGARSNLVKSGAGTLVLGGQNTYTGTTQLAGTGGNLLVSRSVFANQAGPLGVSDSPVLVTAGSATVNAIGLGLSGQVTFDRDVTILLPAGNLGVSVFGNTNYTSRFTGGIAVAAPLTGVSELAIQAVTGGRLEMLGTITSGGPSMRVRIGDTGTVRNGVVYFGPGPNGASLNNYLGNTILDNARIVVGTDSQFAGSGAGIAVASSPFGLGSIQFASSTNGTAIGADGNDRVIPNALATAAVAGNTTMIFEGRGNLTFLSTGVLVNGTPTVTPWNINGDGSLRNRNFTVTNTQGIVRFDTDIAAGGANGVNLLKQGLGVLAINGTVTTANLNATDGNYGTGWFIDSGVLRVTSDAALGLSDASLIAFGQHDAGAPADVRLRSTNGTTFGGTLFVNGTFASSRKIIMATNGGAGSANGVLAGIEVSAGNTLTLNTSPALQTGAVSSAVLVKSGTGTLVLNGTTASALTGLTIGGINGGGGVVRTTVLSGTPLVDGTSGRVTIGGGTLQLDNSAGGSAQNIVIPRFAYSAGSGVQLTGGSFGATFSVSGGSTVFQRQTAGMLTIVSSSLGGTEKFLVSSAVAPANDGGNNILAIPSIVTRTAASQDLNFVKYDGAGFAAHTMTTANSFVGMDTAKVADISAGGPSTGPASATTTYALRSGQSIASGGGTLTIASGGLILNGASGVNVGMRLQFGVTAVATDPLKEALVFVRGGQASDSTLSGGFTALNFTKAGAGTLLISGANSVMAPLSDAGRAVTIATNVVTGDTRDLTIGMSVSGGGFAAGTIITDITKVDGVAGTFTTSTNSASTSGSITISGLRRVTIQEGTLKFANQAAVPSTTNGVSTVVVTVNDAGVFDLNGQSLAIGGLAGTGGIVNSQSSTLAQLAVNLDQSQLLTFSGSIGGNLQLVKTGIGTLTLGSPVNLNGGTFANTYSGGTVVDAGQIIGAHVFAPSALGTLAVRTVGALGTGLVTLRGGVLDLSMTGTGSTGYTANEFIDGFSVVQVGPNSGLNILVNATNNFGSVNSTSALSYSLASPTAWSKINNLTLAGSSLTWFGSATANVANVLVAGKFDVTSAATRVFLSTAGNGAITGQVSAAGKTLVKAGAGTLYLTNTSTTAPNTVGAWEIYAGALELRQSDGGSSPLGGNSAILLNGATLNVRLEGDNTNTMQMLRTFANNTLVVGSPVGIGEAPDADGNNGYIGIGGATLSTDRLGGGANKTVVMQDLKFGGPLGSALLTYNAGNAYSVQFTNLLMDGRDAYFTVNNTPLTIAGSITNSATNLASGTLVKQGGNSLFINGDNATTFRGGTTIIGGTVFFGKFEGVVTSLSDSPSSMDETPLDSSDNLRANSNLGQGNILVNPSAAIQFNSPSNVASGAGIVDVRSNLMGNYGIFRVAVDAPLAAFKLRLGGVGGPQNGEYFGLTSASGFNGVGKNNGGAIIALNAVYTQALNLARLGDGTAFLGSTTNGVGLNGSYNAATLGAGAGNLYRLGAGGATLYVGSDMANTNILSGTAGLIVGMPHSAQNVDTINGGNGRGTVMLLTANNYTGATTVNRGSALEFRGAMATSSFATWGTLTAAGLGGTFLDTTTGNTNRVAVTLRPASELRFDNASGLLPNNGANAQGRWADNAAITLNTSALRLIGNRDVEVAETVGDLTVRGGSQVFVQRDYTSRKVALVLGGGAGADLSRSTNTTVNGLAISGNNGSLQINPNTAAQLGSDERVLLFSNLNSANLSEANGIAALGGVTNGMLAPWIVNGTEVQFLTFTAENGFINAGFNATRSGALGNTSVTTERTFINAAATMVGGAGIALDTYALRADAGISFSGGTVAAADRIRIRSGGLLVNGAVTIAVGIEAGTGSGSTELNIFNNNNLVLGTLSSMATSPITGQITGASNIVKHGAGTLFLDAAQFGFNGNYIINQGAMAIRNKVVAAGSIPSINLGGTATPAQMNAGTNGVVVINSFNSSLNLVSDVGGAVASTFTSTAGLSDIIVSSAAGLIVGQPIKGNGIPDGAYVGAINTTTNTIGLVDVNGAALTATVTQTPAANNNFVANVGSLISLTNVTTTAGATNVTVNSTAGLIPGMVLYGLGVNGLTVAQITSPTTFQMSAAPAAGTAGTGRQLGAVVGTTAFNVGFAVGEGNPMAVLTVNRAAALTTNIIAGNLVMNGGIRFGGSPGEQGQTLYFNNVTGGTTFNLLVRGGLDLGPGTLDGKPAYAYVSTGVNGAATTLRIDGQVAGGATLFKTGGQTLDLNNVNTGLLNTNSGGIQINQGVLNIRGSSIGVPMTGATIVAGSTITVPNTTGLVAGMTVTGPGIPANSTIQAGTITGTTFNINTTATVQTGPQTIFFFSPLNTFASGTPNVLDNTTSISGLPAAMYNGGIGSGALTLYGGTTNIRLDVGTNNATRQRFWVGSNAAGNSLIVNGSSTLTIDRNSGAYSAKHLAFSDMTIGNSVFSVTSGNYVLEINGATKLVGTPTVSVTNSFLLNGAVTDGGARSAIIKTGGNDLWINSSAGVFGGLLQGALGTNGIGIVVNGGLVRFGDVNSEGATAMNMATILRGSTIRVNPTGSMYLPNTTNVTFGAGQIQVLGSGPQLATFRMATAGFTQALVQTVLSSDTEAVLGMDTNFSTPFDLGRIGNGKSFLAATGGARTYSAPWLGVGSGGTYRVGGGGQSLTVSTTVLMGANRLQVGSQAANAQGTVLLSAVNTFTAGTVVSRSNTLQYSAAATAVGHSLGTGQVDVFGTLTAQTNGTFFANGSSTVHQNSIVLHPGSVLFFNNNGSAINNRWGDNISINLNGAQLQMNSNGAGSSTETVGAIAFQKSAQINFTVAAANGQVTLTAPSLTRAAAGSTLLFTTNGAGQLGITPGNNSQRLIISGGTAAITGGAQTNGILPAYYIDATDNTFVKYDATNGFQLFPTASYKAVNTGDINAVNILPTDVVDVNSTALTLVKDVSLYALRINQSITSGVGQYNTITFTDGATDNDRGGLISQTSAIALSVDLKFGNNGDKEGIIYVNNNTLTMNGDLYAGSMTKFGSNTLIMAKDQTANARGTGGGFTGNWSVNQGNLQLNTFGASGTGVITLNPSSPNTATGTTLLLRANPGSALNGLYTMSKVVVVDNAVIDVNSALSDSTVSIGNLEVQSSDTTGLSPARARIVVANQRSILGIKTLSLTGTGASIIDVNASALNNQITAGVTTGIAVDGLTGSRDLVKWGNGALYLRADTTPGNVNNSGFTGNVIVEQGVFSMTNANALSAAGTVTVRRYGVFELFAANVAKLPTYEAGSIERWSVEGARSGGSLAAPISLGAATLQVAADQFTTNAVVALNGGSIEGFLRTDDVLSGNNGVVYRTLGSGVSIVLTGNSFVGQDPLFGGPNGLNNGRSSDIQVGGGSADVNNASNLTETARGVILEIKGNISESGGSFGLSKQSGDTVILSGTNTYSGVTNIAGGTLRVGAATGLSSNSVVRMYGSSVLDISGNNVSTRGLVSATVTGDFVSSAGFVTNSATTMNTLTVNTTAANASFGGVIQNNVNLTKAGAFTQTLTNANTFTGETRVDAGALTVTHTAADGSVDALLNTSKLTVAGGAAFNIITGSAAGTRSNLALAGTSGTVLVLGDQSRLGFEIRGASGINSGKLTLNSGALANVTGTVFLDAYFNSTYSSPGSLLVLDAPSGGLMTSNGSTGTYAVGNIYNGTGANFTVTGLTQSDTQVSLLTAANAAAPLVNAFWKGGLSGATNVWSAMNGVSLQTNWARDAGGTSTDGLIPTSTVNVTFSATTASDQGSMVLGGDMQIGTLTLNDAATMLLQDSSYSLTITGASAITTGAASGAATFNVPLVLSNASPTFALASANALTLGGPVSGAATLLTKSGTGALVLTGANTFAGALTASGGVVRISSDNALGAANGLAATGTTIQSGAALEILGGITVGAETLNISGTGVTASPAGALRNVSGNNTYGGLLTLGGAATIQSDAGSLNLTNAGTITGSGLALTLAGAGNGTIWSIIGTTTNGTLTKNGNGTWTIYGANNYTGVTNVTAGVLSAAANAALGTATNTVGAGVVVSDAASLELQNNITVGTEALTITGAGFGGTGALRNLSGNNTYGGTVTLNASGPTAVIQSDSGLLTLSNAAAVSATARDLIVRGDGNTTISGVIATTTGSLTKTDAGILTLGGVNTYTGTTFVSGGVLRLANATAAASNGIGSSGGTSNMTISGGGVIELAAATDFTRAAGTLAAQVQWTGDGGFGAFGSDRSVNLGGAAAPQTWASGNFVPNGSQLVLSSPTSTNTITFVNPIALNGAVRTVNVNNGAANIDAVISGAITGTSPAGLIKTGPGTLRLTSASNNVTGPTTVNQGTLSLIGSLAGGGGVTVQSGGRFNGGVSGSPAGITSPVTVQSGGTFSAGASSSSANGDGIGQMNVAGASIVEWQTGANLVFDFAANGTTGTAGTDWDFLNISNTLKFSTSAGSINVAVDSWSSLTTYGQNNFVSNNTGTAYTWQWVTATGFVDSANNPLATNIEVIDAFNVSGTGPTGVFSVGGGNYAPINGQSFWVSKQGTSLYMNYGLRAVPEPGSLTLIGLAGLGLAGYRRLRKKPTQLDQTENVADKE